MKWREYYRLSMYVIVALLRLHLTFRGVFCILMCIFTTLASCFSLSQTNYKLHPSFYQVLKSDISLSPRGKLPTLDGVTPVKIRLFSDFIARFRCIPLKIKITQSWLPIFCSCTDFRLEHVRLCNEMNQFLSSVRRNGNILRLKYLNKITG